MLNLKETRFVHSQHLPVVDGLTIMDEGLALVAVMVDGIMKVKPSAGVAGEVFAGVSFSRNSTAAQVPGVVEEVVGADLGMDLGRAAATGQISIVLTNPATGAVRAATIVSTAPASANEVQLTPAGRLVFFAGEAGTKVRVVYQYAPSSVEAMSIKGNMPYGMLPSSVYGIVGVLTNMQELSTSCFDASVDWTGATTAGAPQTVKLGADGRFTIGGNGVAVPNCTILKAPSVDSPFVTFKLGQ